MATVSFQLHREIKTDLEADCFLQALEASGRKSAEQLSAAEVLKQEQESREFLKKLLSR